MLPERFLKMTSNIAQLFEQLKRMSCRLADAGGKLGQLPKGVPIWALGQ